VNDRQRAKRAIETAIQLDSSNVAYQLTLGKLLLSQMFWYNGNAHYEKVIEAFPDDLQAMAEARYWVGYYALQGFLAYQDRLVMGNQEFSEADRLGAIVSFKKSIAADPNFRDPYYHLGLVYLESDEPDSLVYYAGQLIQRYPDDAHAFLFCGMGYQSLGDELKAFEFYTTALNMLSTEEREVIESIEYILTEAERDILSGDGLVDLDHFWRQKDPLLLTAFNESQMDHYRRVAYANLRFSRLLRGIPGWQTDQGKTHIKFGPYFSRSVYERRETWHYGDFRIHFRSGADLDAWYFDGEELGEALVSLKAGYWPDHGQAHFQKQPPTFHDPYRDQKYSMPYQISAFPMKDSVRLEVAYAIPATKVDITQSAKIEDGLFLFDAQWDSVFQQVEKTYVFDFETQNTPEGLFWISQHELVLPVDTYQVIAEVGDYKAGAIGTFRMVKEVAPLDTVLTMSDPLLASRIHVLKPYPDSRDDLSIVQNPLRTFRQSEFLHLYFEVYRLERDVFGHTHYDVSYRVGWPQKEEVDASLFLALEKPNAQLLIKESDLAPEGFRDYQVRYVLPEQSHLIQKRDKNETETEVTVNYEGDRENEFIFLNIDLHQVPVGIHQLVVTVHHAGQRISRDVFFRVVE
jgi:GWxTD domain-containing protein